MINHKWHESIYCTYVILITYFSKIEKSAISNKLSSMYCTRFKTKYQIVSSIHLPWVPLWSFLTKIPRNLSLSCQLELFPDFFCRFSAKSCISEYWTKGNIIGWPDICRPNQPKIFPFFAFTYTWFGTWDSI